MSGFGVVAAYGLVHALIDATTVTTLYRAGIVAGLVDTFWLVVTYNLLAFAFQAALGPMVDALRAPRAAGVLGSVLSLAALLALGHAPALVVVVMAGVGNALFHLGGGAIALALVPARAAPSGIFVAPGAIGLAAGVWIGHRPVVSVVPLVAGLVAGIAIQGFITPQKPSEFAPLPIERADAPRLGHVMMLGALGLLLVTVLVRSVVGGGAAHGLHRSVPLGFALAVGAFLGKLLGGFVADRLGWARASVGALLISLPLLVLGDHDPWTVVVGVLVFQTTMPVTLAASSLLLPGRPATAFGLCCLALVLGATVSWNHALAGMLQGGGVFAVLILVSALGVRYGLRLMGPRVPGGDPVFPASSN
jgi:FSR family fosmidomycin resistance protein-like MFS transporter